MSSDLTGFAYLISAICFIMALRGLSSPETARRGNVIGIFGMVVAIGTTLAAPGVLSYGTILTGIVLGARGHRASSEFGCAFLCASCSR